MAFYELEPFGLQANLVGHAVTAQTITNVNRQRGTRAYKIEEFIPKFGPQKPQSTDQMLQIAQMLTIGLGGEDLRQSASEEQGENQ